jgi:hypothetical protein
MTLSGALSELYTYYEHARTLNKLFNLASRWGVECEKSVQGDVKNVALVLSCTVMVGDGVEESLPENAISFS